MNKRQERPVELVVSRGNATELFELVEQPLDLLSHFVLLGIVMNHLASIRSGRDNGLNPQRCQKSADGIAVVCLVHDHRHHSRQRRHPLPHRLEPRRIVTLSPTQLERYAGAFVDAGGVQLGGQSAPRATQSLGRLSAVFFKAPAAC